MSTVKNVPDTASPRILPEGFKYFLGDRCFTLPPEGDEYADLRGKFQEAMQKMAEVSGQSLQGRSLYLIDVDKDVIIVVNDDGYSVPLNPKMKSEIGRAHLAAMRALHGLTKTQTERLEKSGKIVAKSDYFAIVRKILFFASVALVFFGILSPTSWIVITVTVLLAMALVIQGVMFARNVGLEASFRPRHVDCKVADAIGAPSGLLKVQRGLDLLTIAEGTLCIVFGVTMTLIALYAFLPLLGVSAGCGVMALLAQMMPVLIQIEHAIFIALFNVMFGITYVGMVVTGVVKYYRHVTLLDALDGKNVKDAKKYLQSLIQKKDASVEEHARMHLALEDLVGEDVAKQVAEFDWKKGDIGELVREVQIANLMKIQKDIYEIFLGTICVLIGLVLYNGLCFAGKSDVANLCDGFSWSIVNFLFAKLLDDSPGAWVKPMVTKWYDSSTEEQRKEPECALVGEFSVLFEDKKVDGDGGEDEDGDVGEDLGSGS